MSLTSLFCDLDDFCIEFESEWNKQLIANTSKTVAKSRLTLSETMTIIVYFHRKRQINPRPSESKNRLK